MQLAATLVAVAAFFFGALPAAALDKAAVEQQFHAWIERQVWPAAKKAGVSRATFAVMDGTSLDWSLPDLVPPGSKQPASDMRQSEFGSPGRYFDEKKLAPLISLGRERLATYKDTLAAVEKRYGVPGPIVVAIWGRESGFGRVKLPNEAVRSLATLAFMGARREDFFGELVAALQILEEDHVTSDRLRSSWAGALGQPQFLPSKFLAFAVDFDGDGKRDIWNSVPDTLGSIGNYLARHGWRSGRDWGFEAEVPAGVSCALEGPDRGKPITAWEGAGVARVAGKAFPDSERKGDGFLLMPAGRHGPAFIATENFYVLKAYNESDLYALFIGHLADRMRGGKPFVAPWANVEKVNRLAVRDMQLRLEKRGIDVGGADGLVGFKTRRAIGDWQAATGLAATCFPQPAMVDKVR